MGIGSFFGKLFGAGGASGGDRQGDPIDYQGFTIVPAPRSQNGQFLTAGVIRKSFDDGVREAPFVRADTHQSFAAACDHATSKGKQIVDEQGDSLFAHAAQNSDSETP